jgi:hypothetical protein
MRLRIAIVAAVIALAALVRVPRAHALHCGTHLVTEGDTVAQLLEACGEPARRERGFRRTRAPAIETWTYDFGPTRDRIEITVRDGVVLAIREVERRGR